MRPLILPALLSFLLLLPDPGAAQLRLHLGGGLANPSGDVSDLVESGWQGRAGVRLGFPLFPLSIQAEGEGHRLPAAELSDGHATVLGGNLSAVLTLGGIGISPYVVAGLGRYRVSFSDEIPDAADTATNTGWHGGLGVELGFLGFGGFVEARFVNISGEVEDVRLIPVTVGVRF